MKQKKYLLAMINFILCLAILVSCNPTQDPVEDPTDDSTTDESMDTTGTGNRVEGIIPTIYYFNSYDELSAAFSEGSVVYEEKAFYNNRPRQEKYETFVDYFVNGADFHIPTINGEEMIFRNRKGFHNISLFTTELYWMPSIWYYVLYNEQDIRVCITYPEAFGIQGLEEQPNGVEVIKQIYPDAIIPTVYRSYERYKRFFPNAITPKIYRGYESYKNVYLKELELADQKVSAVFYEFHDDPRIDVRFYYKGAFLRIVANPEVMLDDVFWKSFSLELYQAEEN